ncbi:uncharacterized protein [Apostichopus japonicus]|uniref:uncharacterized protein isoform X2 n=1 Tax=Stichopus japonicus TaxID=307972 RepID=UPI003AB28780
MRTIVLEKLTCEISVGSHFHTVAIRMSQGVYTQKDPIQNREEDGDEEEEGEEDVDKHQKLRAKYRKLKKLLACKKKKALAKEQKTRRKAKTKRVHAAALRNKKCNSYRNAKKAGSHAHEKLKVQSRCETGRSDRSDDDLDMLVDLLEADEDISDVLPSSQQFPNVEELLHKKKQKSKSIYDNAVDGTLVEDGNEASNLDEFPFTQPFKACHWETVGLHGSSTQPTDVGKISERDMLADGRFSRCKETGFEEKVGRQESTPDNTSIFDGLLDETLMEYEAAEEELTSLDYSSSTLPFYQQSKDKNLTENGHLECDGGSIVTPEGRGSKNEMKKESLPQNDSRKYPRKCTEVKNCNLKVCKRGTSCILSNDKIMTDEDGRRETKGNQSDSDAFSDESMIIFSSGSEDEGFLSVSSKPPALTKENEGTSLLTKDKRKPWFIPDMPKERVQKDTLRKTNKKSKKGGKKSEFISEAVELRDAQKRKTDIANDVKVTCSNQQLPEPTNGDSHPTKPRTISLQGKIIGSNKKNKKEQQKPGSLTKTVVGLTDTQDCRNGLETDEEGTYNDQQLTETADGFSHLKNRSKFIPYKPSTIASQEKIIGSTKKSKKQKQKLGSIPEAVALIDTQDCRDGVAPDNEVAFSDQQLTETANCLSHLKKRSEFIPYKPSTIASQGKIIGSNKKNKKQKQKLGSIPEAVALIDTQDCRDGVAPDNEVAFSDQQLTETANCLSHLKKRSEFIPYKPSTIASQGKIIGSNKKNKKQQQKPGSLTKAVGLTDTQYCRDGVATDDKGTCNDQQLTETANGSSNQVTEKPVFIPHRPNVNESSQRSMDSAKEQPKMSEPRPETLELGDNQHCKSDMANDKGTGSSTKCDSHLTKGPPGFIPYEPNVIVSQTSIMDPAKKNNLQKRKSESIPETLQDIAESAVGDTRNPADGLTEEETAKMSDQTKLTDMKGWNLPKGWETYREATVHKKTKGFHEAETHGGDGPVIPSHQLKRTTEICPPRNQQEFTQSTSTQTETTFHQFLSFFSVCEKFFYEYKNVTTTASLDNIGVDIDNPPSRKKLKKVMKKIKKSKRKQAKASKLRMSSSGQLSGSRKRRMKHSAKKRAIEHYTSPTGKSNMLHHPKLLFEKHTSSGPSSSEDFEVHRKGNII